MTSEIMSREQTEEDKSCHQQSADRGIWKALSTQTGGHNFITGRSGKQVLGFVDIGDGFILKAMQTPPRGEREIQFYQHVWDPTVTFSEDQELKELQDFIPRFSGVIKKDEVPYLKLTNATNGFFKPCILDLKMGQITYDQEASPEKIANEKKKFPPLVHLGFQITGMMIYHPETGDYDKYSKDYTRKLTEDTIVSQGLRLFFRLDRKSSRHDLVPPLLAKLHRLEHWFSHQKRFSFIASSLLIVYDGSNFKSVDKSSSADELVISTTHPVHEQGGLGATQTQTVLSEMCVTEEMPNVRKAAESQFLSPSTTADHDNTSMLSNHKQTEMPNHCKASASHGEIRLYLIDFGHVFPANDIDHNVLFGIRKLISSLQCMMN